jgi:hypothetical protein
MKTKQKTKVVSILAGKSAQKANGVPDADEVGKSGTVLVMPGIVASEGRRKDNPRARAKSIDAYIEMKRTRGWDDHKLRKALEKRGVIVLSQFFTGLELSLFLPMKAYKKKDGYRVLVRLRLAQNATYFDACLIVQVSSETAELHKPIRIPVVDTAKAQADEVMRAYHALYDGVYTVVGVESLPGWPGREGLDTMHQKVALAARQCMNRLNTLPELV